MSLTAAEQERITNAENALGELQELIQGAGSKNMLNRLHVLAEEKARRLEERLTTLEAEVQELLGLARKLQ